jgi:hypothetical protein
MLTREEVAKGLDLCFKAAEKVREEQVNALKEKYDFSKIEGNGNGA